MTRSRLYGLILLGCLLASLACTTLVPTPTPTPAPTATPAPPTATTAPTITASPTRVPPTVTRAATATASPTASRTSTVTPTKASPTATSTKPTPTKPAATVQPPVGSGDTQLILSNTFNQGCRLVLWGPADVTVDAAPGATESRTLKPGSYGWRVFLGGKETGQTSTINARAGGRCTFTCDSATNSVRWGCN